LAAFSTASISPMPAGHASKWLTQQRQSVLPKPGSGTGK
jgi:hypothetical protein